MRLWFHARFARFERENVGTRSSRPHGFFLGGHEDRRHAAASPGARRGIEPGLVLRARGPLVGRAPWRPHAHHRALRAPRRDRGRRHGGDPHRPTARARRFRAHGGHQALAPAARQGPRVRGDVPRRGPPRRAHPAPQRRLDPRHRRDRGRALRRHGVRAGRVVRPAHAPGAVQEGADPAAHRGGDHGGRPARAARRARGARRAG